MVACSSRRGPGAGANWLSPTLFHLLDGASLTRISDPPNATHVPYVGRMLLLPTGQVLFAAQTDEIYAYSYYSCPEPAWRPQILTSPCSVIAVSASSVSGEHSTGRSL